ncbi:XRE family transcriptional regulator [Ammoniphilus sp. YIM 78166]|uniref:XRE family transcriptional regulator n=1 Tax=Ammoniphilus sp. YIM 78166 TaxID=1644106 RepID=UPI00106F54F2|nr:XRE family transcriptional regulator [Ammoniphilus sp. YIM 78166]
MRESLKQRSKFGKWLETKGIKQSWIANRSGISKGTICQLANDENRFPTIKNAHRIIDTLREIDPTIEQVDFWDT